MSAGQGALAGLLAAFQTGDLAAATSFMAADIVWHSPGIRQPAAGSHRGPDGVLSAFGTIAAQPGTLSLEVVDVLRGHEHESGVYLHRRHRAGADLAARISLVARVAEGQLVEVWEHIYDLYAFDEFYGPQGDTA